MGRWAIAASGLGALTALVLARPALAQPTDMPTPLIDWFDGVCGFDDDTIFHIEGANGKWYRQNSAGGAANEGDLKTIRYQAYDMIKGKWCGLGQESKLCEGKWEFMLVGGEPFVPGNPITKGGYYSIMGWRMEAKNGPPIFVSGKCFPETSVPAQHLLERVTKIL